MLLVGFSNRTQHTRQIGIKSEQTDKMSLFFVKKNYVSVNTLYILDFIHLKFMHF